MPRDKRVNGAGTVYIKHGSYYGRWRTVTGRRTNRRLGPARRPGTAFGLRRAQAEKRRLAIIDEVEAVTPEDHRVATAGAALLAQLEARDC